MNFFFPMAFGLNFFAITGLMVYLSLIGKSELAADMAIVQASTTALFYAFSGNARSLILNDKSSISIDDILAIRCTLILPLSIISVFLSIYISGVSWFFAILLILRRGGEWLNEIYLSKNEIDKKYNHAKNYFLIQCITLLLVFISINVNNNYFYLALLLWSVTPLLNTANYLIKKVNLRLFNYINSSKLLPHLGSTAVIGIGVYVFRLVILSLVEKPVAGDLFAAFAIGGIIASIFVQAVGPSIVVQDRSIARSSVHNYFHLLNIGLVILGILFISLSWNNYDALLLIGKKGFYIAAIGFSLIGGTLMTYAQHARIKILQQYKNLDVYGPDVLINIIFITSVPFAYYIFGKNILPTLFLFSAIINYIFYFSYSFAIKEKTESIETIIPLSYIKYIIFSLILIPIFIHISSCIDSWCIFKEKFPYYDTKGVLLNLPIPVSILACMTGLILFNNYKKSRLTMTVILMFFVLLVISVVVSTNGDLGLQQSKMILMMQFIIPALALILGQLIYKNVIDLKLMSKAFFYIILILVPTQLVVTWLGGNLVLIPYLYFFSFYQHLQYGPVVIVTAYIIILFVLSSDQKYKYILFLLMPLVGVYTVASVSRLAIAFFLLCIIIFAWLERSRNANKLLLVSIVVTLISMSGYFPLALKHSYLYQDKLFGEHYQDKLFGEHSSQIYSQSRSFYWEYYLSKIQENKTILLFGDKERPDRSIYPSAHNYYLDLVYNFGVFSLVPILWLIIYTIKNIIKSRRKIFASIPIIGITLTTTFLIIVDNFFKVGLRQPYPGIFSFFLWGLLLGILLSLQDERQNYDSTSLAT